MFSPLAPKYIILTEDKTVANVKKKKLQLEHLPYQFIINLPIRVESFVESSSSLWPVAESIKTNGNACSRELETNSSTCRNFSYTEKVP